MPNGTKKPDSQWALCEKLIACCRVAEKLLSENVHLTTPRPPKHGTTEGDDWLALLARERLLLRLLIGEQSLTERSAKENTKRSINQIPSWKSFSKEARSILNHFYWILSSSAFYWLRRCFFSVIYDFIGRCYRFERLTYSFMAERE